MRLWNMETEVVNEKQDSISVSKTSTGKYSFDVKRYYNNADVSPKEIIKDIKKTMDELRKEFKDDRNI